MAGEISNGEDVMDSRDIIERIKELESERAILETAVESAQTALDDYDAEDDEGAQQAELEQFVFDAERDLASWDTSKESAELKILLALQDEAEGSPDWRHGETLIRDSYFTEYAEELANDICEMGKATGWPFHHIDWEAAAKELKQDYTSVSFDGVDYWIRS